MTDRIKILCSKCRKPFQLPGFDISGQAIGCATQRAVVVVQLSGPAQILAGRPGAPDIRHVSGS
jgi:hypothetical protein